MPFIILLCTFTLFLNAQKINLLYDTQSDGSIYPNSIWIVKMIKEAGALHNIEVNFEGAPWTRALQLVKSGQADGVINASYKEERAVFAVYPMKNGKPDINKSLKAPGYYLYKRKDHPLDFDGKQLFHANGKIGAIKSYAVVDNLQKLQATIHFGHNSINNLNNVLYGTTIATAELESEANTVFKAHPKIAKNLVKIKTPIRQKEYYLIISKIFYKKHPQVAKSLWQAIEKLKKQPNYIKAQSSIQQ